MKSVRCCRFIVIVNRCQAGEKGNHDELFVNGSKSIR